MADTEYQVMLGHLSRLSDDQVKALVVELQKMMNPEPPQPLEQFARGVLGMAGWGSVADKAAAAGDAVNVAIKLQSFTSIDDYKDLLFADFIRHKLVESGKPTDKVAVSFPDGKLKVKFHDAEHGVKNEEFYANVVKESLLAFLPTYSDLLRAKDLHDEAERSQQAFQKINSSKSVRELFVIEDGCLVISLGIVWFLAIAAVVIIVLLVIMVGVVFVTRALAGIGVAGPPVAPGVGVPLPKAGAP